MNIWKRLGIEPTNDKGEIKSAFARQSKLYSLEGDAKETKELEKAYTTAMEAADREIAQSQAKKEKEGTKKPQGYGSSAAAAAQDGIRKPPEVLEGFLKAGEVREGLSQRGAAVIQEAQAIINRKKPSQSAWQKFFETSDYRWEKSKDAFIYEFLKLIDKSDIPDVCWYGAISPALKALENEWAGTYACKYINELRSKKEGYYKQQRLSGALKNRRSISWARARVVITLVFVLAAYYLMFTFAIKHDSSRERPQGSRNPVSGAVQTEGQISVLEALPVTEEELSELEEENSAYNSVYHRILTGAEYKEAESFAQELGITEAVYNEAKQEYEKNDSPSALRDDLAEYRPVEARIVEEEMMPHIFWGITQGELTQQAVRYAWFLGLEEKSFDSLHELYTEQGEEALKQELLEYRFFDRPFSQLKYTVFTEEE